MKILIIDDEPAIIEFLRAGLVANMYIIDSATDGERGSFLARTGHYDLIILDYSLPKLDGPGVLKELRQDNNQTPVLMLSVRSELANKETAFNLGADDYLTKPFLFDELLLRVRALIKRPPSQDTEVIKISNLTLSTKSKVVHRGKKEIYLTRREFVLLEFLMRHQGQIISRSEILEHVWDYNADPFSNSIETHVSSLRRKLKTKDQTNLIHTFPGRGYKLALKKMG